MRDEGLKEIGAPASGIGAPVERVLTPRHKDLKAGIWTQTLSSRKLTVSTTVVEMPA